MAVNKVEVGGEIKLDLTQDTVTPETLLSGATAHNAAGEQITGTYAPAVSGKPGDITFYDYDGTIVTSWSLSELANKTALPDLPTHDGLTCQGWNWTLAGLKSKNSQINVGANYITDDGKTRIYIHLEEGRMSPMLGCAPNGTVTVDWGDGTAPDTLTGTSTSAVIFTPSHHYVAPGDYVIELTVSGTCSFTGISSHSALLAYSETVSNLDIPYLFAIKKIEIGNSVTFGTLSFSSCGSLTEISLPINSGMGYFVNCYSLRAYVMAPSARFPQAAPFQNCSALKIFSIAEVSTGDSIGANAFRQCTALSDIKFPNEANLIYGTEFHSCRSLQNVCVRLDEAFPSIGASAFYGCYSLTSFKVLGPLEEIASQAFYQCVGCGCYDFSECTAVPNLKNSNAFTSIPADCEIRVPASLVSQWKAATNWATYADHIVGV